MGANSRPRGLIGDSPELELVREQILLVAGQPTTVLITGKTGTGKQVVAEMLHAGSERASKPFVMVNCATIPRDLLEAALFGHERGAFTGATRMVKGRIQDADGGTLFLDEVGDLSPATQEIFLEVLETGRFYRLGLATVHHSDFRLILATNRDLKQMVRDRLFREDLYHRISVYEITTPPLRSRPGDIYLIAQHFIDWLKVNRGLPELSLTDFAKRLLARFDWPGNVRQLFNILERMAIDVAGQTIEIKHVELALAALSGSTEDAPEATVSDPSVNGTSLTSFDGMTLAEAVEVAEKAAVLSALARCGGNQSQAARLLGVCRKTICNRIKKFGITR